MISMSARESRRDRLLALRRLGRVEVRLKGHEDPPVEEETVEVRFEDVEQRLTAVEGRLDIIEQYRRADVVIGQ